MSSASETSLLTAAQLQRRLEQRRRRPPLATAVGPFDAAQGGGLARGALIELCGGRSSGRFSIALSALAAATTGAESAALVDCTDALDPQAAEQAGVVLSRLLWLRPRRAKEALASTEMTLAAGFGLVVLDFGAQPARAVPDGAWLRLSRAAQAQNAALLVITSRPTTGTAAQALVRVSRSRAVWDAPGRACPLLSGISAQLVVERARGRVPPAPPTFTLPVK